MMDELRARCELASAVATLVLGATLLLPLALAAALVFA